MGFAKYTEDNYKIWTENNRNSRTEKLGGTMFNGLVLGQVNTCDFNRQQTIPRQYILSQKGACVVPCTEQSKN